MGTLEKERATITRGLSGLAMLTTPLMVVMQPTRQLSVRARGDSRSGQQPRGKNKKNPCFMIAALVTADYEMVHAVSVTSFGGN